MHGCAILEGDFLCLDDAMLGFIRATAKEDRAGGRHSVVGHTPIEGLELV